MPHLQRCVLWPKVVLLGWMAVSKIITSYCMVPYPLIQLTTSRIFRKKLCMCRICTVFFSYHPTSIIQCSNYWYSAHIAGSIVTGLEYIRGLCRFHANTTLLKDLSIWGLWWLWGPKASRPLAKEWVYLYLAIDESNASMHSILFTSSPLLSPEVAWLTWD